MGGGRDVQDSEKVNCKAYHNTELWVMIGLYRIVAIS